MSLINDDRGLLSGLMPKGIHDLYVERFMKIMREGYPPKIIIPKPEIEPGFILPRDYNNFGFMGDGIDHVFAGEALFKRINKKEESMTHERLAELKAVAAAVLILLEEAKVRGREACYIREAVEFDFNTLGYNHETMVYAKVAVSEKDNC